MLTATPRFARIKSLATRPIRLAAKDVALSRLKQGFDSPMGHTVGGFDRKGGASFLLIG